MAPTPRRTTRPAARRGAAAALAAALLTTTLPSAAAAPGRTSVAAAPVATTDLATGDLSTGGVSAPVPALDWLPCGAGLEPFLCARAEVPEDYDRPEGPTSSIALTKLPASDPAGRIGTLFTNPGGPGGSGVDFVQQAAQVAYSPEVRARFDVLGFDPRGVARSTPATCFRTAQAEEDFLLGLPPIAFPVTEAEVAPYLGANARLSTRCGVTAGERLDSSSTANVARDMDLLRQAVGDEGLTYAGYSYGSVLGATYAALFPTRARALFIDGTLDPAAWVGDPSGRDPLSVGVRTGQGVAASQTFAELLRLCAEAGPGSCLLASLGDPADVAEQALAGLRAEPLVVPVPGAAPVVLDYATTVASLFPLLYSSATFPLADQLLAEVAVLQQVTTGATRERALVRAGDVLGALADAGLLAPAGAAPAPGARVGEEYASFGGNLASLCAETARPGRRSAYAAIAAAQEDVAPHFGPYRAWVGLQCEGLGADDPDAYLGPWEQATEIPVLVAGTRFDPATAYGFTAPYAASFPDGRLLTVEGVGHTTLGVSSCADALVTRYLVDVEAPPSGAVCGQDVPAFPPPVPGAGARALLADDGAAAREALTRTAVLSGAR
ncbi:alpha/beta fold hydrolase [uncultured Pseudokineococcus sp.]|uniref:alpha/beta fold hydrolase n=1 Tax=uncultured Pseudokineococcus sp. TaxID=1642928 RepID=UPI0026391FCD|nr:alpha/beta fold hydrolase [uncultured Pseudokineococcus sp.]